MKDVEDRPKVYLIAVILGQLSAEIEDGLIRSDRSHLCK